MLKISSKLSKNFKEFWPFASNFQNPKTYSTQTCSNDLESYLKGKIKMKGPITVSEFMKEALSNPKWGYYMKKDVFGSKGDFITAPEISQIFGELLGVWFLNEWYLLKNLYGNDLPDCLQLVEVGPGRGTLMSDVLKVWSQNKTIPGAINVYMIETSPFMRKRQLKTLCNLDIEPVLFETYKSKLSKSINIVWLTDITELPRHEAIHFFLANEFFDALPFQKFKKTESGVYREILVDYNRVLNKFQFIISKRATLGSEVILNLNPNYHNFDHVEVSSESARYIEIITKRLQEYNGSMLIIDYGHNGASKDTFRAFKDHKIVEDVFQDLGECDLTVDVDFSFLKHIALKSNSICYGPVEQRNFLNEMQISLRLNTLLKSCKTEADKSKLIHDFNFLMEPKQMGEKFKVMAIRKHDFKQTPPGFLGLPII